MNRALWFLTWLRFKAWLRRLVRGARTVKGALLAALGVLLAASCLASWLFSLLASPAMLNAPERLEEVRRFGPLGLLAMCLLGLLTSSGERAVVPFSPAEVNFLFAGPFTRRQLLTYKLMISLLSICLGSAFFFMWSSFLRVGTVPMLARYLGIVLALAFVQLFNIVLGFTANAVGVRAYNRWRKVALGLLLGLVVLAVLSAGRDFLRQSPREMLWQLEQSQVAQTLLTPLRWLVMAVTSEHFWPDFARWAGLSVLVDGGMVLLVFALDSYYMESAAAASERLYAQVQRIRKGGAGAALLQTSGKARFTFPALPWLGGIGPIAWRQLLAVPRSRVTLVVFFILLPVVGIPMLTYFKTAAQNRTELPLILGGQVLFMTIILSGLFTFDFRGDVERLDVLKSLPIGSIPLVIGQLLTPMLLVSLIQAIALGVTAATIARPGTTFGLGMALLFVLPFNFLLFGVDNLLFLLFPTKVVTVSPGDFQALGRYALLNLAKFFVLALALAAAGLLGTLLYFVFGNLPVSLAAAWLVLAGFAAGLVPLIALAFRRFDVARDTPA